MPARLETPHQFRERLLLYGGGGTGKTTAVLSIARAMATGHMFVLDNDYSFAYQRALETDFTDCTGKVTVFECDADWEDATRALREAVTAGEARDDARDCWLVVDSASPMWDMVQSYITEQITGSDVAQFLTNLRASAADVADMNRQLVDQVPWQIVKKEYAARVTVPIRSWPGHLILTAETKKPGKSDLAKSELADWYQHLGAMPAGETRIHYVTSTTLFMTKPNRSTYRMTTVKDRNRAELENKPVGDFAADYLRDVAGWKVKVVRDG